MRPNIRWLSVAAALISLAAMTSCAGDSDRPSYQEATKQLIADGDKLLASREVAASGKLMATERADKDAESGCTPGEVQRFFRAQGDLSGPPEASMPDNAAGLMRGLLGLMGYDTVIGQRDLRDANLGVSVMHNPKSGLTFIVTVRKNQSPHIMIAGKTGCYGADH
ncbi:hypothetical protein ACFYUV_50790 [Nonomuraea sp. NPDC003560]|uniref:hypothetical protein n=1 Tax=Nonomuraea sp. NPDC003560 TaxID=3364341 RepID=UPI0036A5A092